MKKILTLGLTLVMAALLLAGCGGGDKEKGELNLYTFDGLFPQEVLNDFTKETGIKINYSSFDTNEAMLSKLESTEGGEYDLVVVDDYIIETAIQENLVKELDKEKISNYDNLNPLFQGQYFDPENKYSIPYGAGIQAIVYSPERTGFEIRSFDDLLNPALKGRIGVVNNARFIYGASLLEDGESVNEENPDKIKKAAKQVQDMAPNIRLIKDYGLQDDIVSGEIDAAVTYTSEVTQACVADPSLKVVYSQKKLGFGVMAQFIPVNAPNADSAYAFIDYILRPEVSKKCFESIGYYSTNKAADDLIEDSMKPFLTLPEGVKIEQMDMMHNVAPETLDLHMDLWTQFRQACGMSE